MRDIPFVLLVAAFVGWLVLLGPTAIGGPATYVWVSGVSMEPTLSTGDLVILRRAEVSAIGEVVAFRVPEGEPGAGALVIHRIVGGSAETGFITQGDNKRQPDAWRPRADDIVGTSWLVIPGAGFVVTWFREPSVFAAFAAALTAFSIVLAGSRGLPTRPLPGSQPSPATEIRWSRAPAVGRGSGAATPVHRWAAHRWGAHDDISPRIVRAVDGRNRG